jgi:hypothetical protein
MTHNQNMGERDELIPNENELILATREILSYCDPHLISLKDIRAQLEAKFGVELSEHRDTIRLTIETFFLRNEDEGAASGDETDESSNSAAGNKKMMASSSSKKKNSGSYTLQSLSPFLP